MKQMVVIAAALSLGMLTGCSSEKQDPAAQALRNGLVESRSAALSASSLWYASSFL